MEIWLNEVCDSGNVLISRFSNRVAGHKNRALIVSTDLYRAKIVAKFKENRTNPSALATAIWEGYIFCLSKEQSDSSLCLGYLAKNSPCNHDIITCLQLAIVWIWCLIEVGTDIHSEFGVTFID